MKNTNKLGLKALVTGAALGLGSGLHSQTLLQDKDSLGFDDVAYNNNNVNGYISIEGNVIKLRDITGNIDNSSSTTNFSPIAIFDAQEDLNGNTGYLGMYMLESDGTIGYIIPGTTFEQTPTISLNPTISGATSFVGGASNQADRSEFLAVGDNDTFSVYDSTGIAKWTHTDTIAGKTIKDLEGSVTENNGSAYFTGVFKYLDESTNDFEFADQTNLELTAVPEPAAYGLGLGALALGAAAARRRPRTNTLEYKTE